MAKGRKTGGRTKGTPNQVTATVRAALTAAFDGMGGVPALLAWAKDHPAEFYTRLWSRLIPTEVNLGGEPLQVEVTERVLTTRHEAPDPGHLPEAGSLSGRNGSG